jgi:putative transposase
MAAMGSARNLGGVAGGRCVLQIERPQVIGLRPLLAGWPWCWTPSAKLLQRTILDYRSQGRFLLHAFVIMPDHFHALITPAPDVSLEKAMQYIKGGFSFRLKSNLDVWTRSFNESQVMSEEKFASCVRYIEENPVRRGLVSTPQAYPFSSVARDQLDPMPLHLRG